MQDAWRSSRIRLVPSSWCGRGTRRVARRFSGCPAPCGGRSWPPALRKRRGGSSRQPSGEAATAAGRGRPGRPTAARITEGRGGQGGRVAGGGGYCGSGHGLEQPVPDGLERAMFAMGCFWGAERKFWELPGVYSTAVGYAAGSTPNPTYREVCTGMTGHAEVVRVAFHPKIGSEGELLKAFWENHDPTPRMSPGND